MIKKKKEGGFYASKAKLFLNEFVAKKALDVYFLCVE